MKTIEELRKEIDQIDEEIKILFVKRMEIVSKIKEIKEKNDIKVEDLSREREILDKVIKNVESKYQKACSELFSSMMSISKDFQNNK